MALYHITVIELHCRKMLMEMRIKHTVNDIKMDYTRWIIARSDMIIPMYIIDIDFFAVKTNRLM